MQIEYDRVNKIYLLIRDGEITYFTSFKVRPGFTEIILDDNYTTVFHSDKATEFNLAWDLFANKKLIHN
ncbi:MAG: hypothetical protein ACJASL_000162 [Paraglaciecola sp.]|jgi:hypothetical protein